MSSALEKLQEIKKLLDLGLVTQEEFDSFRKKVVSEMMDLGSKTQSNAAPQSKDFDGYEILETLDKHFYSTTYHAKSTTDSGSNSVRIVSWNQQFQSDIGLSNRQIDHITQVESFSHSNVAGILEFTNNSNTLAVVTESKQGKSLNDCIDGPVKMVVWKDFLFELAHAIDSLHQQDLVHGAINTRNVLVCFEGKRKLPYVLGLGVCPPLSPSILPIEELLYWAPQQYCDVNNRTKSWDRYSFYLILYQMLTGALPWIGTMTKDRLAKIKKSGAFVELRKLDCDESSRNAITTALKRAKDDLEYSCKDVLRVVFADILQRRTVQTITLPSRNRSATESQELTTVESKADRVQRLQELADELSIPIQIRNTTTDELLEQYEALLLKKKESQDQKNVNSTQNSAHRKKHEMKFIKSGRYLRVHGAEKQMISIEDPFWIASIPVTVHLFNSVMNQPRTIVPNRPKTGITWREAILFCNALSEREGLQPVYRITNKGEIKWRLSRDGYRLPTEAEWELACRGNRTPPTQCWSADNATDELPDVQQLEPNGFGLFDMFGLVWEWCWDPYGPIKGGTFANLTGPVKGIHKRVLRGASITEKRFQINLNSRKSTEEDEVGELWGFRICRNS
jgi:formylglycine-generating enzyme